MKTIMNDSHIETLEQVRKFLDGAAAMEITISSVRKGAGGIIFQPFSFRLIGLPLAACPNLIP
jgi:hypothetical protein